MTKNEFLTELRQRLRRLPQEEIDNAIAYYEEYFNEAGPENEADVIAKIGSPAAVAAKIIGEYAVNNADSAFSREKTKDEKNSTPIWLLVLAIISSPIALPVSFAMLIAVSAIVFALFMVFFAFGVSGIALFAGGILAVGTGAAFLFTSFPSGIFFIGCALLSLAAGAALVIGIVNLAKLSAFGIQKMLGKFLIRKGSK